MNINKYIALVPLLVLASCRTEMPSDTLSGNGERTPLAVSALMDGGAPEVTRAAGMNFSGTGDTLLSYIRHVEWNGQTDGDRTSVTADRAPMLVSFRAVGNSTYDGDDVTPIGTHVALGLSEENTHKATTLTVIDGAEEKPAVYWDDFSAGAKGDATDLRTDGHYLQSYYGYCYNAGRPSTALTESAGTLGWAVQTDQNSGYAFLHSDLLWSAEQTPVAYAHVDGEGKRNHGSLILPYTHAMSKVTIHVTVNGGFEDDYMLDGTGTHSNDVVMTLNNLFTVCTCTAPTASISGRSTVADITMKRSVSDPKQATYEAIVVPSILSIGNTLATITNLDNNTYTIPVTESMLQMPTEANGKKGWGSQLRDTLEYIIDGTAQAPARTTTIPAGTGHAMKSGVNYVLNVTIDKQAVTVSATIRDWIDVTAEGRAEVNFSGDVAAKGTIADELRALGIDVYKSSTNSGFTTKSSTLTWNDGTSKWVYDPIMYWAGQQDESYFRALAPAGSTTAMEQGSDVLWGTSGNAAVTPRTGDVPLTFEHAMSKITVRLDGGSTTDPQAVNVSGAHISIIEIYDGGTLDMIDGSISGLTASSPMPIKRYLRDGETGTNVLSGLCVIPQSLIVDKDGNDRTGTATFYTQYDLTPIYSNNTSIADGSTPVTYVTATLDKVCYTAEEAAAYNAALPGAVSTSTVREAAVLYTQETADAYNATLPGAVKAGDVQTAAHDAVYYTLAEYNAAKHTTLTQAEFDALDSAVKVKTPAQPEVLYTVQTAKEYNRTLTGAVQAGDIQTPAVNYTAEEAAAYNAALSGAVTTADAKSYTKNASSVPASIGDIKSTGTRVMMSILLADNTSYTLDLAKCLDEGNHLVEQWQRGKHYTYTITLRKEQITFRANVKDWIEVTGGGEANLDWD